MGTSCLTYFIFPLFGSTNDTDLSVLRVPHLEAAGMSLVSPLFSSWFDSPPQQSAQGLNEGLAHSPGLQSLHSSSPTFHWGEIIKASGTHGFSWKKWRGWRQNSWDHQPNRGNKMRVHKESGGVAEKQAESRMWVYSIRLRLCKQDLKGDCRSWWETFGNAGRCCRSQIQ